MYIKENAPGIHGHIYYELTNIDTGEKITGERKNLVVQAGKKLICSRLIGSTLDPIGYMGIGGGITAPLVSDTELISEKSRRPVFVEEPTENKLTFYAVFPAGQGTGTISEAGLFNQINGGVMFSRSAFNTINKAANQQLVVKWEIIVG